MQLLKKSYWKNMERFHLISGVKQPCALLPPDRVHSVDVLVVFFKTVIWSV